MKLIMQNEQCQHIRFKGNTLGDDICADCGLSEMQITHRASVENEQMLRVRQADLKPGAPASQYTGSRIEKARKAGAR